jgi:hypothetical protein
LRSAQRRQLRRLVRVGFPDLDLERHLLHRTDPRSTLTAAGSLVQHPGTLGRVGANYHDEVEG